MSQGHSRSELRARGSYGGRVPGTRRGRKFQRPAPDVRRRAVRSSAVRDDARRAIVALSWPSAARPRSAARRRRLSQWVSLLARHSAANETSPDVDQCLWRSVAD